MTVATEDLFRKIILATVAHTEAKLDLENILLLRSLTGKEGDKMNAGNNFLDQKYGLAVITSPCSSDKQ